MSARHHDASAGFRNNFSSEEDEDPGRIISSQVFSDAADSDSDSVPATSLLEPARPSPRGQHYGRSHSSHRTAFSVGPDSRSRRSARAMMSFGTTESLSTIEGSGGGHGAEEMASVYQELQVINDKLKREFKLLHEKDQLLKEKEDALVAREDAISCDKADFVALVEAEVKRRMAHREQEHQLSLERFELQLKEKTKDHRRLKDNFDTLKSANDTLRKELDNITKEYGKLERQASSLQARLHNLQRHREQAELKETDFLPTDLVKKSQKSSKEKSASSTSHKVANVNLYEVLGVLLGWVAESSLRQAGTDPPTKPPQDTHLMDAMQEKYVKVLPALGELLRELPSSHPSLVVPCLQFIYWALIHTGNSTSYQKTSLTSALRRLGGELYKPRAVKFVEDKTPLPSRSLSKPENHKDNLYFRSSDVHVRLVSSLIILQTITQVDHVAHVFEVLKTDLKTAEGKELFLHYQATGLLLPYLRPSCKAFQSTALDVYLHMTMESPVLAGFLVSCSQDTWFRALSTLFRAPNLPEKLLEKISIVLQKLSKIRTNKRLFDLFGVTTACQEMLRTVAVNNGFLALNLKSILFNLSHRAGAPGTVPGSNTLSQGSLSIQTPGSILS